MNKIYGAIFTAIMVLTISGCKLPPLQITTLDLDSQYAAYGQIYSRAISVSGGSGKANALRFSIESGALPMGLSLDALTGEIQGIPTLSDESTTFTVQVEDVEAAQSNGENDPNNYARQQYSLTVVTTPFSADDYEALDDNRYSSSRNILNLSVGQQAHNFHLPDDADIYIIDLTGIAEDTPLVIESNAIEGQPSGNLDLYLKSFNNPTGDPIHYAGASRTMDSHALMYFRKGTANKYYLYASSSTQVAYAIELKIYESDAFEPDDSPQSSENVVYPGKSYHQFHTFSSADEDWVVLEFDTITPGTLYEFMSDYRSGTRFDGTQLALYDAAFNPLAENDFRDWVTDSKYARIYWYFDNPGRYYLKLTADSENGDGADLQIQAYEGVHPQQDPYESLGDNDFSTQNLLTPGTQQSHTLHVTGDEDHYALDLNTVATNTNIVITAGRDGQKSPPGVRFYLYDSEQGLVLEEWGFNGTATATYKVTQPGDFFLKVDSVYDDTGYYKISIE